MARRRSPTAVLLVGLALVAVACGDSEDPTVSGSATTSGGAASTAPSTAIPLPPTTPFTFPERSTAAFVAGDGSLTITGDQPATAQLSMTSCSGITVTEPRGLVASLVYVADPGGAAARRYILDLAGLSPGTTTFPEAAGFNQVPPRRVRLSVEAPGDFLTWGTTAAGTGTVSGTVMTRVGGARSGTFNLELGFSGSEGGGTPATARGPVTVTGAWNCP